MISLQDYIGYVISTFVLLWLVNEMFKIMYKKEK